MALVVLVGLPGTGKSTVGRALADRLDVGFVDTDDMLGHAPELMREIGESAFRERERDVLQVALATSGVVATGGGIVSTLESRALLIEQPCVWLRCAPAVLVRRVARGDRPLLGADPAARLEELAGERTPLYELVARRIVDVERARNDVLEELVQIVGEWSACA